MDQQHNEVQQKQSLQHAHLLPQDNQRDDCADG
jgi:hypothetical protein